MNIEIEKQKVEKAIGFLANLDNHYFEIFKTKQYKDKTKTKVSEGLRYIFSFKIWDKKNKFAFDAQRIHISLNYSDHLLTEELEKLNEFIERIKEDILKVKEKGTLEIEVTKFDKGFYVTEEYKYEIKKLF